MAIRYKMLRLPVDIFNKYHNIKRRMEDDLTRIYNRPVDLTIPQFFDTLVNYNKNWIEVDLDKLNFAFNRNRRKP